MLIVKNRFVHKPYSLLFGFFILLLAQPDFSPFFCFLASSIGYGFLFFSLTLLKKKKRFFIASFFFALIELTHLSWLLRDAYVGKWIYLVTVLLCIGLGLQMGIFSLFLRLPEKMTLASTLALASFWTLMEWSRLFVLSGFPFDPIGLSMSVTDWGSQMAAIAGIYGMSFWVILTNLFFYQQKKRAFFFCICCPFLWGQSVIAYYDFQNKQHPSQKIHALLVQSGLLPEEKHWLGKEPPLAPQIIWEQLFSLMQPFFGKQIDLIVMSEGQVPYGFRQAIYSKEEIQKSFQFFWKWPIALEANWVANEAWGQGIAELFDADVIIGLDDFVQTKSYNAAFLFAPGKIPQRYDKRILLPMGEYIPFSFCKRIAKKYGIVDSYSPGKEAKVLHGKKGDYGTLICMEENYGHLTHESRKKNAQLLVGLSNDVWYPDSRLPYVHFLHARLRAIECGIPLLRSCNTGVTCAVDPLGRTIKMAHFASSKQKITAEAILVEISLASIFTLYSLFGDYLILTLCGSFLVLFLGCCLRKKGEQK